METVEDVVRRGEEATLGDNKPTVHEVRDVAPNKIMLCLSFRITPDGVSTGGWNEREGGEAAKLVIRFTGRTFRCVNRRQLLVRHVVRRPLRVRAIRAGGLRAVRPKNPSVR